MILGNFARQVEKFTTDNSPAILTVIGVVGTVGTAYLTGKASFAAADILREEERDAAFYDRPIDTRIKVMAVWKLYIPAAGTGVMTIVCVVAANRVGTRRAAAMAAAYGISERAFTEYKEKVLEKFGENKERQVRDAVAQDRTNEQPSGVIVLGPGRVLFLDKWSMRYFESTVEEVKKAMNDTNYEILHQGYCSLSDFYLRIGLATTAFSEDVGWNSDNPLELHFSTTMSDDQRPCMVIDFHVQPIRKYNMFGGH